MTGEPRDGNDDEPALTEELRALLHPRTGRLFAVLGVLFAVLLCLLWVALQSPLTRLWREASS